MKAIRSYDNYLSANIQLALLKDAGIDSYLKDEYTITIDPLLSPAIGGMKLMVREEDIENANRILDAAENAFLETLYCSNCGQKSVQKVIHRKIFNSVWEQLWSILKTGQAEEQKTIYKCYNCGQIIDKL